MRSDANRRAALPRCSAYLREPTRPIGLAFGQLHSIPDKRAFQEFRCSVKSEMAAHAARRAATTATSPAAPRMRNE